jgi:hypothetical protein
MEANKDQEQLALLFGSGYWRPFLTAGAGIFTPNGDVNQDKSLTTTTNINTAGLAELINSSNPALIDLFKSMQSNAASFHLIIKNKSKEKADWGTKILHVHADIAAKITKMKDDLVKFINGDLKKKSSQYVRNVFMKNVEVSTDDINFLGLKNDGSIAGNLGLGGVIKSIKFKSRILPNSIYFVYNNIMSDEGPADVSVIDAIYYSSTVSIFNTHSIQRRSELGSFDRLAGLKPELKKQLNRRSHNINLDTHIPGSTPITSWGLEFNNNGNAATGVFYFDEKSNDFKYTNMEGNETPAMGTLCEHLGIKPTQCGQFYANCLRSGDPATIIGCIANSIADIVDLNVPELVLVLGNLQIYDSKNSQIADREEWDKKYLSVMNEDDDIAGPLKIKAKVNINALFDLGDAKLPEMNAVISSYKRSRRIQNRNANIADKGQGTLNDPYHPSLIGGGKVGSNLTYESELEFISHNTKCNKLLAGNNIYVAEFDNGGLIGGGASNLACNNLSMSGGSYDMPKSGLTTNMRIENQSKYNNAQMKTDTLLRMFERAKRSMASVNKKLHHEDAAEVERHIYLLHKNELKLLDLLTAVNLYTRYSKNPRLADEDKEREVRIPRIEAMLQKAQDMMKDLGTSEHFIMGAVTGMMNTDNGGMYSATGMPFGGRSY